MKKQIFSLLLLSICLFLAGCGDSWKSKIELTDLKIDDDYIVGKIKNKTDNYYNVTINYEVKNGDFSDNGICILKLKPNAVDDLKCLEMNYDSSYKVEVKSVDFKELTIPKLDNNNLNVESLEYYYKEIYDTHALHLVSLVNSEDRNYPYIDKIIYHDYDNSLEISYKYIFNGSNITTYDLYDIKTKETTLFNLFVGNPTEENITSIIVKLSGLIIVDDNTADSYSALKALSRKDIEEGKCVKVGRWCVSTKYDDILTTFYMEKR